MSDLITGSIGSAQTSRRGFLKGSAAAAFATGAGGSLLTGCGSAAKTTAQAPSAASDVLLPTYVPITSSVAADLPATAAGVPAGFYKYPTAPAAAFGSPPLSGSKISAMTTIFGSPPPGRDANPGWQAVEKQLGATIDLNMVVSDQYDAKLSTSIAGSGLPDIMLYDGMNGTGGLPNLPQFLDSQIADLTPLLGGDKVKDYPHLAAIPSIFWEQCTSGGRLYFIPIPRAVTAGSGLYHQERLAAAGLNSTADIKSSDDFMKLLKDLTDAGKDRYAIAGATTNDGFSAIIFHHVFGTPNQWRVDAGGKLTKDYETDEYKAAVEFMAQVYKAGCYYPGSQGWTKTQMQNAFQAGKVSFIYDSVPAMPTTWPPMKKIDPTFVPLPIVPFGHAGGKGVTWQDNVNYAGTMLKKASPARLQEVLKLADFLAAPFGTQEYLAVNYGAEGQDYKMDANNNPILTDQGKNDSQVPWKYLGAPSRVIYNPGANDLTDVMYKAYADLIPLALPNPCSNLYSPTSGSKNATLTKAFADAVAKVVTGQASMDAFDAAVKSWRSNGGDAMRTEFEQAYAHAKTGGAGPATPSATK